MDIVSSASQVQNNPFIFLTFIVAPAILTNASALMVMSTSNRFARAIDRGRELYRQLEGARKEEDKALFARLKNELLITEKRAVLLLSSMRAFYFSLGGFAFAAFISLVGAGLVNTTSSTVDRIFAFVAMAAVFMAVGGLVTGSVILFYETRITVGILQGRIKRMRDYSNKLS